jgi:hypothetical protein
MLMHCFFLLAGPSYFRLFILQWYDEQSIELALNHMQNFMLFSDLQKQLSPSPIKTWRLLKQLRDEGRMKEDEDFRMQDRKLYVNVPRFIVELESMGYANVKSDDITSSGMKSDDIKKLADELRLISNEITESRIQEEMKSDDFSSENSKPNFVEHDASMKSQQQNMKSAEINNTTNSSTMKSNDFTFASREIIDAKNEVIDTLKGSIRSKEDDVAQLRAVISDLTSQLKTTTQQNAWLTNLLVAPKQEPEPMRTTTVNDITDESDEISDFNNEITQDTKTKSEPTTHQNTPTEERAAEDRPDGDTSDAQADFVL